MGLYTTSPRWYSCFQTSSSGNTYSTSNSSSSTTVILYNNKRPNDDYNVLTKGDANPVCDRGLYEKNQIWLNKKHIQGRIKGYLPYIGILTIILNDYPWVKYAVLGLMGIFVLTSKDPQDT